ncbi:M20/M25/M40 family metallo-hydrolase [Oceanimonas sp. NS1]|nr:M20/M25/M40 family metallo-hydrolase [Oceanimonas sp. NS1]
MVTGSLGLSWFDVVVTGQEAHAGPTPMEYRRDALQTACALVSDILTLAEPHAPHGRVTCGEFRVFPNSRNVIPGRVNFSVDLRHLEPAVLTAMEQRLRELCDTQGNNAGIEVELLEVQRIPPTPFAPKLVERVRACTEALAIPHRDMVTGAGHDAVYISRVAPTAMIFVPCVDGISHNECEDAKPEDLEAGANVLLHAMLQTAEPIPPLTRRSRSSP